MNLRSTLALPLIALALTGCGPEPTECSDVTDLDADGGTLPDFSGLMVESSIHQEDRARAIDVVFVAEGFTAEQLPAYRQKVKQLIARISSDPEGIVVRRPAFFNFHRVDTTSATNALRNAPRDDTAFRGCLAKIPTGPDAAWSWLLRVDTTLAIHAANQNAPSTDVVVVVLNSDQGRANTILPSTLDAVYAGIQIEPPFRPAVISLLATDEGEVLTHELGHGVIGLADEYSEGDKAWADPSPYDSIYRAWVGDREFVVAPNVTVDPIAPRWQHLVPGSRPGGALYKSGVYHPTDSCRMLDEQLPKFCPVCSDAIDRTLDAREGVNDGPPQIALAFTENPSAAFYSVSVEVTAFDRNRVKTVEAALDGQSWITRYAEFPDGGWAFVPSVLSFDTQSWLVAAQVNEFDAWVKTPNGDHTLTVKATDTLGESATRTVPIHVQR